MLPLPARDVYEEMLAHINRQGGSYPDWYCGIASNWVDCLLIEHKVPKKDHPYIARQCYTSDDARAVEKALLGLGCDGAPKTGDKTSVYVYAYLKGAMTNP